MKRASTRRKRGGSEEGKDEGYTEKLFDALRTRVALEPNTKESSEQIQEEK